MNVAIEAKSLDVGYRNGGVETKVISGLDLQIRSGEFLTILGPSGCGKSTLLRVVSDLLEPLGGEVRVLGGTPREARAQRRIGFVFQDSTLLPWRTVIQNISLPSHVGGRNASPLDPAHIDELLDLLGLTGLGDRLPSQLSGGQRQRVAIARALYCRPDLLLMDEPFGALDEITRDRLNDELLSIWRKTGTTVLFVTHSIMEATYLGQRVIVLAANPGRLAGDRDLRAAKSEDNSCEREAPEIIAAMKELRHMLGEIS